MFPECGRTLAGWAGSGAVASAAGRDSHEGGIGGGAGRRSLLAGAAAVQLGYTLLAQGRPGTRWRSASRWPTGSRRRTGSGEPGVDVRIRSPAPPTGCPSTGRCSSWPRGGLPLSGTTTASADLSTRPERRRRSSVMDRTTTGRPSARRPSNWLGWRRWSIPAASLDVLRLAEEMGPAPGRGDGSGRLTSPRPGPGLWSRDRGRSGQRVSGLGGRPGRSPWRSRGGGRSAGSAPRRRTGRAGPTS